MDDGGITEIGVQDRQEEPAEIVAGWGTEEIVGIGTSNASMYLTNILDNYLRELEAINRKLNHPDVPEGKKEKLLYRRSVLEKKKREITKM